MKLKNITYLALFLFFGINLFSQSFHNEWIVYSQNYYKIKIAKDGLYKIDSTTLANAGVPLSTINPKNIQLFHKGKEIYPYIFGENDGIFNAKDYILFYAEKNKSTDDSLYYDRVPYLTNPYYSVINDTAAVFLTWNSATSNRRLTLNTDTTYSQSTASPYYYKEIITGNAGGYSPGPLNFLNLSDPRYKLGEGFFDAQISETGVDNFAINTSAIYTAGPLAYITVCLSGANDIAAVVPDHIIAVSYTDNTNTQIVLKTDSINEYETHKLDFTINPSQLGANTNLTCTSLVNSQTSISNYANVNYIRAVIPQQFNLLNSAEEKMYLPDDGSQSKSKLVITNFTGNKPFLVNITDSTLHTVTASGGNYLALVPNSGKTKLCYLADSLNITPVSVITPVNGNGQFVNYQPQIADSNYLLVYHPSLATEAMNYKTFRSSMAGGSYPVIAASTNDLYDQFGYGVEISPMAIRNFCAWVIAAPNKNPSNLFLLGKGIHSIDCVAGVPGLGTPASAYKGRNLVPSWGYPSADALITQGLPGSYYLEPAIPTGRLAAQNNSEVAWYLSKVNLYVQQTDDSLWKKNALHFVGGKDYYEQQALSSYMNACRTVFEDTAMGGKVFSFYKTSTAPISVTTNDSVRKMIENGVLLMTFFGHGSQTGFDQNIDDPQNYNNSPKFPLIVGNSCYTGDIHSGDQQSNSEVFTLAPNNKGSIGFLATVSEGVANDLYYYTQAFYKQMAAKSYGQSYAACVKKAVYQLMYDQINTNSYPGDSLLRMTAMEMTFHGDPAIAPYTHAKPDYGLRNSDVIFNTTKYVDSIGVQIVMSNYGKAIRDSFTVSFQRNFPNGDTVKIFKRVKAPYYQDTLNFNITKDYYRAVGLNCFDIKLDFLQMIPELSEVNNSISGACLFIPGADIEPVWPYKYAIVPNVNKVTLKASTADPFAPLTTYRFQVDTNNKFLTPLTNTLVSAPGGVVSLPITLYGQDSMVYFWRVAKDTTGTPNWKESSFQVINGKYGWGQAHFHQFKNDAYQYVVYSDSIPRLFKFVNDVKTIEVTDVMVDSSDHWSDFPRVSLFYNNAQQRLWSCEPNGWTIAVFDTITGNLQYTDTLGPKPPGGWLGMNGNCVCDPNTKMAYDFGSLSFCGDTPDWRTNLTNFLTDSIPNNTPVLAYTVKCWQCSSQDTLTPALINAFHSIGSTMIDSLKDTTLLIIYGRKGMAPGQAHEVISRSFNQFISLEDSIVTKYKNGYIASEIIGPCQYTDTAWKSLHWYYRNLVTDLPAPTKDSIVVRLIGINSHGQKFVLANFPKDSLNVLDLSRYASGKQFPYLQLIAYESDNQNNTPPQLQRWQIIYDPAAEAAIDPPSGFAVVKNKVAEGEDYKVRLPIKNISDFAFNDSLVVTYQLEDANRVSHPLPFKLKNKPFLPDSIIFDTISVSTLGFSGSDVLWIDVNPPGHAKYQPEQYHFNNIAQLSFQVDRDKINPLLDVTFDGVHILNGDIVSAKPNVLVSLKDENKFLALNDTANFKVFVQLPGASTETRLFFKDVLQFTPAQLPNNSCKINYRPVLPQDGVYTLHIVATDRSSNLSGQIDYKIQFEVVNKPTITEVLNYPNPFSTSTRFVFTITGSEVPETFKVQILTITGRVVKEITREELGFLHVGRNITEYAWDGTDQFGDKLANGVYLYRVETRLHGNEIDHLSTAADGYFKKGYGKMLLMR